MSSAIDFLNLRGDFLLFRAYREDVSRATGAYRMLELASKDCNPVQNYEGMMSFFHTCADNMYAVAATKAADHDHDMDRRPMEEQTRLVDTNLPLTLDATSAETTPTIVRLARVQGRTQPLHAPSYALIRDVISPIYCVVAGGKLLDPETLLAATPPVLTCSLRLLGGGGYKSDSERAGENRGFDRDAFVVVHLKGCCDLKTSQTLGSAHGFVAWLLISLAGLTKVPSNAPDNKSFVFVQVNEEQFAVDRSLCLNIGRVRALVAAHCGVAVGTVSVTWSGGKDLPDTEPLRDEAASGPGVLGLHAKFLADTNTEDRDPSSGLGERGTSGPAAAQAPMAVADTPSAEGGRSVADLKANFKTPEEMLTLLKDRGISDGQRAQFLQDHKISEDEFLLVTKFLAECNVFGAIQAGGHDKPFTNAFEQRPVQDLAPVSSVDKRAVKDSFLAMAEAEEDEDEDEDEHGDATGAASLEFRGIFDKCRANEYQEVHELLCRGCDPNMRDELGNTPLVVAVQNGNKRITQLLLQKGADKDTVNHQGNTPLHYAFKYGNRTLGKYLLAKNADDTIRNVHGKTCYDEI